VAGVPEQPPEPLGASHRPVGDDEDTRADARSRGGGRELVEVGKRMPSARPGLGREVAVDVEEARARDVPGEVELAAAPGVPQLPAAVDEPDPHAASVTPRFAAAYVHRQPSVEELP
jgi:hypothetical protein